MLWLSCLQQPLRLRGSPRQTLLQMGHLHMHHYNRYREEDYAHTDRRKGKSQKIRQKRYSFDIKQGIPFLLYQFNLSYSTFATENISFMASCPEGNGNITVQIPIPARSYSLTSPSFARILLPSSNHTMCSLPSLSVYS